MKKYLCSLILISFLTITGCENHDINSEFHTAVLQSNEEKIIEILDEGFDVNSLDGNTVGRNVLHSVYDLNIAKLLVARGADLEQRDKEGATPLCTVLRFGQGHIAMYYIDQGADINVTCSAGRTVMYFACMGGEPKALQYLIDKGLDVNAKCHNKTYPIFVAIKYGNYHAVKCLLDNGADCFVTHTIADQFDIYPIQQAIIAYNSKLKNAKLIIELLLKHMDMSRKLNGDCTFIHYAVGNDFYYEHDYIYDIAERSDINSLNSEGWSVLDRMELLKNKSEKHRQFYEYLLKNGAKSLRVKGEHEHDFIGGEINENKITAEQATLLVEQIIENKYSLFEDKVSNYYAVTWCDKLIRQKYSDQSIRLLDYLYDNAVDDIKFQKYYFSSRALIMAASVDNEKVFDHLIKLGVDPNSKSITGKTFFEYAKEKLSPELCNKYLERLSQE